MKTFAPLLTFLLLLVQSLAAKDPVDYVDPFVGTGHFGKTYPGAATPGGLVALSPDTITGGDNGSGYRYYHKTIQGFSFTHMTGVGWYGDLGNFLVMPTTGPLKTYYGVTDKPGTGYLSGFSHESEKAEAGYYSVKLDDYGILAEMTALPHSGILRFTFPANQLSRIQVDLARRVGGTSLHQTVKVIGDHTIEGEMVCTPAGGGWGHGNGHPNYTVFYHAEFSQPFQKAGVWSATLPSDLGGGNFINKPAFIQACQTAQVLPGCEEKEGEHLGFYTEFPTTAGQAVQLKVGISYVSVEGARANLAAEIPDWNFELVHQKARQLWADALGRMAVEGSTEANKTTFYTSLYHAFLEPQILADLNGDYPGGDGQVHHTTTFTKRTIFSGWDVYRSEFPLMTLIDPQVSSDLINSFVELADQNNLHTFDRWEFLNAYSGCMNGTPSVTVLNDAYQKGIRNYNVEAAYQDAKNSVGNPTRGFSANHLSSSMEDMMAYWNLAQLAAALGKTDDAKHFNDLAQDYKQLFDPNQAWTYDKAGKDSRPEWKGWFRTQDGSGNFEPWMGLTSGQGCQESTVYQEGWCVPFDVPGMIALNGGPDLFVAKLSDFFDRTPDVSGWSGPNRKGSNEVLTPYYNQPNEPVHLVPFLFNRAGAPWLTQKWIRVIDQAYQPGPEGLCGDEDCGQMSAWFVLAASGLAQACPGATRFEIFTPLFDQVTFRLDPKYAAGGTFTVKAKNNSPTNVYIQSATLNGQPLDRCWLDYKEIVAGGTLELVLGAEPNKGWGMGK